MQKLYDELFNLSEEKKTSENDNQLEENTQSSTIRKKRKSVFLLHSGNQ